MASYEYAAGGALGLVTPQANPTAEAELRMLLPDDVLLCATRARSRAERPEGRLREYFERLEEFADDFDALQIDALAFACTGSAYLVGARAEARMAVAVARRRGVPLITATQAIARALRAMGARRLHLISPYPTHLLAAAVAYWREVGFAVGETVSIAHHMSDTRDIYALDSTRITHALDDNPALRESGEPILVSGTGLPSLSALWREQETSRTLLLSSNLCLAWAALAAARPGRKLTSPRELLSRAPHKRTTQRA